MVLYTFMMLVLIVRLDHINCMGIGDGSGSGLIGLYNPIKDDVEILNKTNFKSIFGTDKVAFVEFYAHWCGACQRYAQHWKEIAKETKAWHSRVVRVAAINCGDPFNDEICREFNIEYYPTLKLFPAQASYDAKDHDATLVRSDTTPALIAQLITYIEHQAHKPASWPELEPYTSKRLDTMFITHRDAKFGFLIFEKTESDFGRKLILDFSSYTDRVLIRRVIMGSSPTLFTKLEVDMYHLPSIYLINNTHEVQKVYEKFDKTFLQNFIKSNPNNGKVVDFDALDEDTNDDDQHKQQPVDQRKEYFKLIKRFIKYNNLITHDEANKLHEDAHAGKVHADQVKKEEAQSYLTNIDNRIFMQDLESGLHIMLRSEISRSKLISGDKLKALRNWMRVLVKYFPGRKSVRNYLKMLYTQINSTTSNEITGQQWKLMTDTKTPLAFLPDVIEWRHCKGSEERFRGYPCSLWTLFHVLTTSQTEIEKSKPRPFDQGFDIAEVIEAIRLYITNFFGCAECRENFAKETFEYTRFLNKPYDAVKYLWEVHNRVNKRLSLDTITEQDPAHPKVLFPTQNQCPKCYLPTVKKVEDLADHESPWVVNEVLLFLTSFYSKYQIEGIQELNTKYNSISDGKLVDNRELVQDKIYEYDNNKENVLDAPESNGANKNNKIYSKIKNKKLIGEDNLELDGSEHAAAAAGAAGHHAALVGGVGDDDDNEFPSTQKRSDIKLSLFFVFIVIFVFVSLYVYFLISKRKTKLKKHII